MMWTIPLTLLALFGHLAFWVAQFNRVHAIGLPRWGVSLLAKIVLLAIIAIPLVAVWLSAAPLTDQFLPQLLSSPLPRVYLLFCFGMAAIAIVVWLSRSLRPTPKELRSTQATIVDIAECLGHAPCAGWITNGCRRIPGNQLLQMEIATKTLALPRLPPGLDGLKIVHLSDLHLYGHMTREFFTFVVEQANLLEPDLVAVTGDLMDHTRCLPWLSETLGRLRSRHGTYCILGNHDMYLGQTETLLRHLADAGLNHVGGQFVELAINGHALLIAGNERPWFRSTKALGQRVAEERRPDEFRLVLSHSPDQIDWARRHDFDLMLAGHTHGGQIRFPLVGAVIANCLYGVKYASGLYAVPPTLLHVTRGVSGIEPIRLHCRPEIAALVLTRG
jgi:uncharacterized protein